MSLLLSIYSLSLIASASPLKDIQSEFKAVDGFKVEFEQIVEQELFPDDPQTALGHIRFQRPEFMEWAYRKPKPRLIQYKDGELFVEEDGERQRMKGVDKLSLEQAFSFLWGETDPQLFKLEITSQNSFRVIPKVEKAGFKSIDVFVADGRVQKAVVTDNLDGKSRLLFKNWKVFQK